MSTIFAHIHYRYLTSLGSRLKNYVSFFLLTLCFAVGGPTKAEAIDLVKLSSPSSPTDTRNIYKNEVLKLALKATQEEYGPFWLSSNAAPPMERKRVIKALEKGEMINVYISPAVPFWSELAVEIPVPIRRGAAGYRLLITHKDNLSLFENVNSLDELKKLKVGSIRGESFTKILDYHNLNMITADSYDSSFIMLTKKRFNWMSRGVFELFDELKSRNSDDNIRIVPDLVLYATLPTYIYVSRAQPRLAERLTKGLNKIATNGELKNLFDRYYADDIKRAQLDSRKIIKIKNPYTENNLANTKKQLWISVGEYQ